MKYVLSFAALVFISVSLIVPVKAGDNDPVTPYIQRVNPEDPKPGGVITADGTALGKALVSEIYLTRGSTDIKLEITSQKAEQIVAKLPATLEAGRYKLMLLTAGAAPRFIEQPVALTVQ